MGETFNKKEREKKKEKRRKDKESRKEARKDNPTGGGLENMMAYVDENGMISDTPPDPKAKTKVNASSIEIGVPKKEKEDIDPIMTGTISFYDDSKGYGFIKSGDESFFMHCNNVSGQPAQGKRVSFEKEKGAKGWTAVRVKIE